MKNFLGTMIEESLVDTSVFKEVKILSTRISNVTDKHKTPWIKKWTLNKVEIEEDKVQDIAEEISRLIDQEHKNSWYADFKNESVHYVVYFGKVFKIDRTNKEQYQEAAQYGLSLGIPAYQIDFADDLINK